MEKHKSGQKALRRGRISVDGGRYFITAVTRGRTTDLTCCFKELLAEGLQLEVEGAWRLHGLMGMTDHAHLAITLGAISLSSCVQRWKGRSSKVLRAAGLHWQKGYHDHRLRANEEWSPFFRYMLLNPYCAMHVDWSTTWRYCWWCSEWQQYFLPQTNKGLPFPEWVAEEPINIGGEGIC